MINLIYECFSYCVAIDWSHLALSLVFYYCPIFVFEHDIPSQIVEDDEEHVKHRISVSHLLLDIRILKGFDSSQVLSVSSHPHLLLPLNVVLT